VENSGGDKIQMGTLFDSAQQTIKTLFFVESLPSILDTVNVYQLLLDIVVIACLIFVVFKKKYIPEAPLTHKEIEDILNDWQPEPLHPSLTPQMKLDAEIPIISSTTATHVCINDREVLNLARTNFSGMIGNKTIEEAAIKALYKYGTGTCGPRGFYGTIDVHLELEVRIRDFMNAEDTLIYAFGFATVSSAIPALSGRGDLLVVDRGVSYSLQTGCKLSRSKVMWFDHNDMDDLERVLKEVQNQDRITKKKITRRFIIIEGLYFNHGDLAPLRKIMELKDKYCWRIILDDSCGVGVIGKTGRGTCEYFDIPVKSIDILTGNFDTAVGGVGGFCCGSKNIIYHQRLNASGYVYSASLPPLLTCAAYAAFDLIDKKPKLLSDLAYNTKLFYNGLSSVNGIKLSSIPLSPIIHMRLAKSTGDRYRDEEILQKIVNEALNQDILLTRAKYVPTETFKPFPSIRICMSCTHTEDQLRKALEIIKKSIAKVLKN